MEMRSGSVFFPRSRGSGPRLANSTPLVFPRQVSRATAGMTGYTAQFLPDDHHLGQLRVQLNPVVIGNTVSVAVTFGLRDWSGDWDDDYSGTVNFVVLAELEAATTPPPRPDVQILDAEFNQVIQFFRSSTFLDPSNVRPDNSVPLIERKPTGLRLYVDYDSSAGLPAIASLSGEVEVQSPAGIRLLTPTANIAPQREFLVQRGQVAHTLNFTIPEELCVGVVTLRARVFSANDPSSRSALFERTVQFVNVPSLRVYLVGVNFTGLGMNLPAPTQAQMTGTVNLTERMFPTGELLLTGYQVLPFSQNLNPNGASGCGSGFSALLDQLSDLQGNSSDVYYAELPAGVNTANVAGCAHRGDGLASSGFAIAGTAAHEIGHALGLQHTPCGPCPSQPSDIDDSFPQYNGFSRNSIGEFGYDPLNNSVFNPATTFDLLAPGMSPRWMSPYNYSKLFSALGGSFGGGGPFGDALPRLAVEILNLRLTIYRDRSVERDHSFHFPATRIGSGGHATDYVVEFIDEDGQTLACFCLSCSCNECGPNCYPVLVREHVPMPTNARLLRVWEGRDKIVYEEEIPDPSELWWKSRSPEAEGMVLEWEPKPAYTDQDLRYLVQFEDRPGVWRGVAPRSADTKITVPWAFFKHRASVHVRVLASSGIATGVLDDWIKREKYDDKVPPSVPPEDPPVVVSANGALEPGKIVGSYLRAVSGGGTQVRWYDEAGAEISGSATLDLRGLPDGQHVVRAVTVGGGALQASHSLLIEKRGERSTFVRDFKPKRPGEPHVHPHPAPRDIQP